MRQLKITRRITSRDSDSVGKYLLEVSKLPLLDEAQEADLAHKIASGDEKAVGKLVEGNLRFVISVAKQYQNQGLSLPDLINEGNIGLIKAARKFDNERGFKFISYAVWWIRQSILQAIAEQSRIVRIPCNQTNSVNKVNRVITQLEQKFEREPTPEEIEDAVEALDLKSAINVKDVLKIGGRTISLDSPVSEGEDMVLMDYIPNPDSKAPDADFNDQAMQFDIDRVLAKLPAKQKRIVCMSFGLLGYQAMTLEEIGDYFELTRERVRQIKEDGIKALKKRSNSSVLRQYFATNSNG